MQVYVHLAGKNHDPYSIDQLRQYVQAGHFRYDQLACYDGTNWMRIKNVPGFSVEAKVAYISSPIIIFRPNSGLGIG